jgi:hypothetical protein
VPTMYEARYNFILGKMQAMFDLAIWRDGVPVVGVLETPYSVVKSKFEDELAEIRRRTGRTHCDLSSCSGCADCETALSAGVNTHE